MFTGNQDVLVEFARLAREYPAEPVENLWEQAGGTTTLALASATTLPVENDPRFQMLCAAIFDDDTPSQ